jgi:hypothetical protein
MKVLGRKSAVSRDKSFSHGAKPDDGESKLMLVYIDKKVQHMPDQCLFSADNSPYIRKQHSGIFGVYGSTDGPCLIINPSIVDEANQTRRASDSGAEHCPPKKSQVASIPTQNNIQTAPLDHVGADRSPRPGCRLD